MKTYRLDRFDPLHFQPTNQHGEIRVEFHEFLFDPQRQKGMIRVMVTEENLIQHLWIAIAWGETHWHIRPARGCEILPTVGLQQALDLTRAAAMQSTAHQPRA